MTSSVSEFRRHGVRLALTLLGVSVLTPSMSLAQSTLFHIAPEVFGERLGESVAALGDVNGDGIPDFAISGMRDDIGIVRVFSGGDRSELYTISSAYPYTAFGFNRNLTAIGDLDGDGISEIAIGTPWGNELESVGFFDIHSGADGSYLTTHRGNLFESLSNEIARLGDVDGDGVSDYAASTFEKGSEGGYVAIYSGKDQLEIGRLVSDEPVWFWSIAGPGDLNGDGFADIAIGLWSEEGSWVAGQVRVLSGAIFTNPLFVSPTVNIDSEKTLEFTLWTVDGKLREKESLGMGLNALGDIDGDGVPDLGVGTGALDDAIILSGADGSRLHEWHSDNLRFDQFFVETEAIGDANGDGVPDIVVGRPGSLTLHSGKGGEILARMSGVGDLGEEIAAIGDLDGDGLSEILAGAPGAWKAVVVSFALKAPVAPDVTIGQGGELQLLQSSQVKEDWILESSGDLMIWAPLDLSTTEGPIILDREQFGPEAYFRWRAP